MTWPTAARGLAVAGAVAVAVVVAITTGACIPDYGDSADAGQDGAGAGKDGNGEAGEAGSAGAGGHGGAGAHGGAGGGSGGAGAAGPCVTSEFRIEFVGTGSTYVPASQTAPVGQCIEICIDSQGAEPHENSSPDGLFEPFTSPSGEKLCRTFVRRPAPGTYKLVCSNHAGMTADIVIQ